MTYEKRLTAPLFVRRPWAVAQPRPTLTPLLCNVFLRRRRAGSEARTGATLALTWALMELFWTNEKAAMAARPRPLPPSPPPSHTPRPLLDPLRRPPANGRAASPPPYESDGGRAMADGVMADEQKFVSPAAGIRTRAPTNARLSR
ncbi:hypothetical protein J6590_074509 [Homalodisca vitripennis]|nr:hypothetical protein J6590_074509 [Homalodisca vitripennis]